MDEMIATAVHIIRSFGLAISFFAVGFTAYMVWFLAWQINQGYSKLRWMWVTAMWTEINILLLLFDIAAVRVYREIQDQPFFWLDLVGVMISLSVFLAQARLARWVAQRRRDASPP